MPLRPPHFNLVRGSRSTPAPADKKDTERASHYIECCLPESVDALVFNPPYVPTDDEEVGGGGIEASWAGGLRGRRVLDRLLPHVARVLAPAGRFYVVCVAENDPASIVSYLRERGLTGETVLRRRARNEALSVLRFVRSS